MARTGRNVWCDRGQSHAPITPNFPWSETTPNYWMMVETYPNLKEEVGGSIPDCEVSSLLDINLSGGQLPPKLWRWHIGMLTHRLRK